jgi:hypothetical protein
MSLTASELLTDAKLLAMPYLREESTAPGPLLRVLTALDSDVVRQVAIYAPERLSAEGSTFSVNHSLNLAGYPLSPGIRYGAFAYLAEDGSTTDLALVPGSRFPFTDRHPSGIIRGGGTEAKFYPCDPFGRSWETTDSRPWFSVLTEQVAYRYVPAPARVTALAQTMTGPDEARDYYQWMLCAYLLGIAGAPEERIAAVRQLAGLARDEFITNMMKRQPTASAFGEPIQPGLSSWVLNA